MAAVSNSLLQDQLHQFLCRRAHILKALPEGNDCKAHSFKVLNHLHCAPTVKGDFAYIEMFTQVFNELLNETIMNDVSLCGL